MINDDVSISVIQICGRTVKLGINYPKHIRVFRQEIYDRIKEENIAAAKHAEDIQKLLTDEKPMPKEDVA